MSEVNRREWQMLAAVAAGRGELVCGCEPDLLIDGGWCDHAATRSLVRGGLIRGAREGSVGARVEAVVTAAGWEALSA
jgi:hypothetical protein